LYTISEKEWLEKIASLAYVVPSDASFTCAQYSISLLHNCLNSHRQNVFRPITGTTQWM